MDRSTRDTIARIRWLARVIEPKISCPLLFSCKNLIARITRSYVSLSISPSESASTILLSHFRFVSSSSPSHFLPTGWLRRRHLRRHRINGVNAMLSPLSFYSLFFYLFIFRTFSFSFSLSLILFPLFFSCHSANKTINEKIIRILSSTSVNNSPLLRPVGPPFYFHSTIKQWLS